MREEHLKQIKEACIKANPEIRGFGFGQRFQFPGGCYGILLNGREWKRAKFLVELPGLPPKYDELMWSDMESIKVFARPIRLADVLLAAGKDEIRVSGSGTWQFSDMLKTDLRGIAWNLRKDNLTDQSDECIAFLAELLAKE